MDIKNILSEIELENVVGGTSRLPDLDKEKVREQTAEFIAGCKAQGYNFEKFNNEVMSQYGYKDKLIFGYLLFGIDYSGLDEDKLTNMITDYLREIL